MGSWFSGVSGVSRVYLGHKKGLWIRFFVPPLFPAFQQQRGYVTLTRNAENGQHLSATKQHFSNNQESFVVAIRLRQAAKPNRTKTEPHAIM